MEINCLSGINRQALFSSETEDYRNPIEPDIDDDVVIRFRTAKDNVDHVYYVEDGAEVEMDKVCSDELFDYYEYEITVGTDQVLYHFKAIKEQEVCILTVWALRRTIRPAMILRLRRAFTPGLGKGSGHVPDICGPLLQWRQEQ